jgi:hypothetical protein
MSESVETVVVTREVSRFPRTIGMILAIVGILLMLAGVATYITVSKTLSDERITTTADACLPNRSVTGPFTAYCQAQVIAKHTAEATGGKTYAELAKDDPLRQTAMTSSFLRSSLFTSVVAFGLAALAILVGALFTLTGVALRKLQRDLV